MTLGHHLVGVLPKDLMLVALLAQPRLERCPVVARLPLIEVHRDDLERHGCPLAGALEQVQQRVAVLAAADGDHHAIAGLDELEVRNAPPHLASESLFQGGLTHARWVPGERPPRKAPRHLLFEA